MLCHLKIRNYLSDAVVSQVVEENAVMVLVSGLSLDMYGHVDEYNINNSVK